MAAWSEWSDWSRTGPCKGTLEPYARSRTCTQLYSTSSPMVTSTVCAENQAQSQVRNATVSSCTGGDSSFIGVALGITSSIALLLIVIGIVLCILSMKLWVRRQSYNIRVARMDEEITDNIPVYQNFHISPSQTITSLNDEQITDTCIDEVMTPPTSTTEGTNEDNTHVAPDHVVSNSGGIPPMGVSVVDNADRLLHNAKKETISPTSGTLAQDDNIEKQPLEDLIEHHAEESLPTVGVSVVDNTDMLLHNENQETISSTSSTSDTLTHDDIEKQTLEDSIEHHAEELPLEEHANDDAFISTSDHEDNDYYHKF